MQRRNAAPGCAKAEENKPRTCRQCKNQSTLPTVLRFAAQCIQLCVVWSSSLQLLLFYRRGFLLPVPPLLWCWHTWRQAAVGAPQPETTISACRSELKQVLFMGFETLGHSCYIAPQSFISLLTAVCFPTTCTGWNAGWHGKLPAKQAKGPNSLQNIFLDYSLCVPAHVFLGMHHMVLHLQDKLWACREKLRSA